MTVSKQPEDRKKNTRGASEPVQTEREAECEAPVEGDATVTGSDQAGELAALEAQLTGLQAQVAKLEDEVAAANDKAASAAGERDTWQAKATAIYDQYLRNKADFDSYRKRTERDAEDKITRGKADFLRSVLDVMDNFDRFLQAAGKGGQEGERSFEAFFKGVSMVRKQLMDVLTGEGVEPIEDPVGKMLDPNIHDAIAAQDGGGEHGTIIEEVQKGYVFKGLVLRPAKVRVIR